MMTTSVIGVLKFDLDKILKFVLTLFFLVEVLTFGC